MKKEINCICNPIKFTKKDYPELNRGEMIIRHSPFCGLGKCVAVPDGKYPSEYVSKIVKAWKNNPKNK